MNNNPYKDYLPQNRYKKESNNGELNFSPKLLKKGLYIFYGILSIVVIGFILYFNGYNLLKIDEELPKKIRKITN